MFDLKDKVAIVTGSTSGIGKAIALVFAKAGARVIVTSRTAQNVKKTTDEIQSIGWKSLGVCADVCIGWEVEELVRKTIEGFGRVDVLVNCAGGNLRKPALELSEDDWDAMIRLNLTSAFLCSQAAAKEMVKQGGGNIINIASVAAIHPTPNIAPYSAAKGGIISLTRTLAREWAAHHIRVNTIAAGWIDTPGARTLHPDHEVLKEKRLKMVLVGRLGVPDDIASMALFLASDAAGYITAKTFEVDGGICVMLPQTDYKGI